jgi:hypothetical protein
MAVVNDGSNVLNSWIKGVVMKMKVIADRSGRILATYRPMSGGGDAPSGMRVEVEGGHEHEVDIPTELVAPALIHKLHSEYLIDLTCTVPKLIKPR